MSNKRSLQFRRQFLRAGLAGSMLGLAGCARLAQVQESDGEPEPTEAPDPNLESARFRFEYDERARRVAITYRGGARIVGGDLQIRSTTGKQIAWSQLGSTTADTDEPIRADATAKLGASILNWDDPVDAGTTIRLVYTGQDAPATLGRFTASGTTTLTTTVRSTPTTAATTAPTTDSATTTRSTTASTTTTPDETPPSIRALSVANTGDDTLRISFDSSERLAAIRARISGAASVTLTASDFDASRTGDAYTYEATYQATTTGTFTVTLTRAVDASGNDGAGTDEASVTIETDGSGDPVAGDQLLARWPLRDGLGDSVGGHDASVDRGDPTSDTFAGRSATAFHGDVGARISRGDHGELSLLGRNDGACSFSTWVLFDTDAGGRPYDSGETAVHTLLRNDTGYVITGAPAEDADGVDIGFAIRDVGASAAQKYTMPDGDNVVVSTGEWHHVAVVVDPTNSVRIYVDGDREFSDDSMDGYSEQNSDYWSDLTLGSWYGGNPAKWANILNGKLSDFRIYETGLSESQISRIHEAGATGESNSDELSAPISAEHGLAHHDGVVYGVSDGQILAYDLEADEITDRISTPSDGQPEGLAYGNGSLWFADAIASDYDGKIVELDPATGDVESEISTSWDPRGLAFGGGSLWAVDITGNNVVAFDPDGTEQGSFSTADVSWGQGLAYADGSLWLGNDCDGDGCTVSLREFDTDGSLIQRTDRRSASPTTGYGGLAATDSKLLGPSSDGSVTELRTLE
ncbi:LamG-like jellyroll fold domain-containing protein [Halorussus marinus]|uniref:LamG-like jellyroll fold domain-containing protein n=1 Tax=Halorussus marinus TaxID=2505976 RepID=UPI00109301C9|nr:LamG-like jellyroll fold domain-containing protein [Halorussus marinus]